MKRPEIKAAETESVQHNLLLFTFDLEPPIKTLYLTEHVSSVQCRDPEGRISTVTEIRD